jgi:hypothetical protein
MLYGSVCTLCLWWCFHSSLYYHNAPDAFFEAG